MEDSQDLRRKLSLTEKTYKQQVAAERHKYAGTLKRLEDAEKNIAKLRTEIRVRNVVPRATNSLPSFDFPHLRRRRS